jgi:hypothetical protein
VATPVTHPTRARCEHATEEALEAVFSKPPPAENGGYSDHEMMYDTALGMAHWSAKWREYRDALRWLDAAEQLAPDGEIPEVWRDARAFWSTQVSS